MWPIDRPPQWVNRGRELAALSAGVEALRRGGGTAVWVEGEPGIGKSSLVAEALAGVSELGWDVGWGMADQLAERLPLSVIQDCLQVRLGSPDPRRAQAASLLRSQRLGLFADGDAAVSSVEVLMALADELCAAAPTVMVVDDLQWADAAGHRRPAGGGRACTRPGRLDLRGGTAHAALISKILDLPGGYGAAGSPSRGGSGGIVPPGGQTSSPTVKPASCATCRPTSRRPRSLGSYSCR